MTSGSPQKLCVSEKGAYTYHCWPAPGLIEEGWPLICTECGAEPDAAVIVWLEAHSKRVCCKPAVERLLADKLHAQNYKDP